ncbi:Na+/H+ antiporter subunit E [Rehaibacterium terrae]|uniref:Multisubunit Na+/H+ antiporter MnhE subunit n=1 Tax=Rehaibacterium terrae TaxID=1341696 RepID=A0A7W7V745_9GAMM|nr:Na+/H+ antiporter subunit E [Rehaibacterium terrae]MBB5014403.1 multisubunit Na+/H+ antiporter MnhE subunit [Rehaibacterium terrae]
MKLLTVFSLLLRFLLEVAKSGLATAWLILRPGVRPTPGLVRMRYAGLSDTGVALLGCMITLTPGTTVIDIDNQRRELLIHLLDDSDPAAVVANVRRSFETPLRRLFPAGDQA